MHCEPTRNEIKQYQTTINNFKPRNSKTTMPPFDYAQGARNLETYKQRSVKLRNN